MSTKLQHCSGVKKNSSGSHVWGSQITSSSLSNHFLSINNQLWSHLKSSSTKSFLEKDTETLNLLSQTRHFKTRGHDFLKDDQKIFFSLLKEISRLIYKMENLEKLTVEKSKMLTKARGKMVIKICLGNNEKIHSQYHLHLYNHLN